ncbi:AAA ATPase domain protein [Leptotrichia wadei]|uniref:AAA ATPase domain protein n=1 Tax=Leptotrichia wadei TaxID=157687 RepID=A0A7U6QZ33_9FUSO|nr:AAA family ATPase [Leptotrichia wadei]BBM43521.1 AAA ATPase domain protein [Leptotrichia wadei]
MKLKKIEVKNYRILKDFKLDLKDNTTLIIGKNNTGKTSVLTIMDKLLNQGKKNFKWDDFNIEFQNKIYEKITTRDFQVLEENRKINEYGIRLTLFIEYTKEDFYGNIQDFMMDLDEDNNYIIIEFNYNCKEDNLRELLIEFNKKNKRDKNNFTKFMRKNSEKYFNLEMYALKYNKSTNSYLENEILEISNLNQIKRVISFNGIKANREVSNKENENSLSKLSEKYFDISKTKNDKEFDDLRQAIEDTDKKLNILYNGRSQSQVGVFSGITRKIREFSGNRNEINININSQIQEKELFKSSSRLYFNYNKMKLPENHNGLGYLNLIGMIFEIENIVNDFTNNVSDINILYIEEPEAHTHPQLQYIFIRNIKKLIDSYRESSIKLQTLITTHSSHIVSECNFNDIRYFVKNNEGVESKNIEILKENYKNDEKAYKFLKQYLTLNSAELFFSEKVIFIEGTTERILLPYMMKKIDLEDKTKKFLPLLSQNISVIEVGNYTQKFKNFIEFLNIKVLIITDIDAAKENKKCNPVEATESTNSSIKVYLEEKLKFKKGQNEFKKILTLTKKEKIVKCGDSEIMIVYQVKEKNYQARSFEDAFISINYDFIKENKGEFSEGLKNKKKLNEEKIDFYNLAQECIDKKSSFAIEILLCSDENYSNWKIPKYIKEGLEWLKED